MRPKVVGLAERSKAITFDT
jgi:hypothetical protein